MDANTPNTQVITPVTPQSTEPSAKAIAIAKSMHKTVEEPVIEVAPEVKSEPAPEVKAEPKVEDKPKEDKVEEKPPEKKEDKQEDKVDDKVVEKIASRFAALSRKEKALREQKEQLDTKSAKYKELENLIELSKTDPMETLKKLGITYEQLTSAILKGDKNVEIGKLTKMEKENAKDFVEIIYRDSERLAQLIDDILDLSKIESDKMKMALMPTDAAKMLERSIAIMTKQAKTKSIVIKLDAPEALPKILADEARISQVLINLLDNAIKYTRDGGAVTVSAHPKDKYVQIDISDTGIGIPEEDIARIFERFYRVDKARSRELGGTGLGLSIVKHIVQAHAGEVWVKSAVGQGSTFSFIIPKV